MGISRDHLVGPGGLIALVERAAVRYAAKDAGDKDGIVGKAEAAEDLVLVAGLKSPRMSNWFRCSNKAGLLL